MAITAISSSHVKGLGAIWKMHDPYLHMITLIYMGIIISSFRVFEGGISVKLFMISILALIDNKLAHEQ